MTVFILDLDWLYDFSEIPNVECMKTSSFHKQRGDQTYLVNNLSDLTMSFDRLYVWGEQSMLPPLDHKILNDKRTVLFGKRFILCGAKKLGAVILGCRPDYLLYDTFGTKNSYTKANFVTFFDDNNNRIVKKQDWHNTNGGVKRTIVTDEKLWQQKPEDIIMCLSEIVNETNIAFLHPISLKCLINNESVANMFCELHFSRGTEFKWRNDVGQTKEDAQLIVKFLRKLKTHTYSKIGMVPFKTKTDTWQNDLKRLLQVAAEFKQYKFKCFLPDEKIEHPPIYKWLKVWLNSDKNLSFIEFMLFFAFAKKGVRWYQVLNDMTQWGNAQVKFLVQLLTQKQWQKLLPEMSIRWGEESLDFSCIDLKLIMEKANLLL